MYLMNLLFVKKSEKFCIEIIDMKYYFWFMLIVYVEFE